MKTHALLVAGAALLLSSGTGAAVYGLAGSTTPVPTDSGNSLPIDDNHDGNHDAPALASPTPSASATAAHSTAVRPAGHVEHPAAGATTEPAEHPREHATPEAGDDHPTPEATEATEAPEAGGGDATPEATAKPPQTSTAGPVMTLGTTPAGPRAGPRAGRRAGPRAGPRWRQR